MVNVAPLVMGIINVTPDSFSGDGLLHGDFVAAAVAQAKQMATDGADILDIGGESSRPGAVAISVDEEIARTAPVIAAIKKILPYMRIAIDTVKSAVADEAIKAGADIINDVSALSHDPAMASVVVRHSATIVLMHNRAQSAYHNAKIGGEYAAPVYGNVVQDVMRDLNARVDAALAAGIGRDKIILDPGVGFGKNVAQNLALIAHLNTFKKSGLPLLMGVSRKSFIGHVLDTGVDERLEGTAACITACVLNGADILRVHDVKFMARIAKMAAAIKEAAIRDA